jgi:hypothetical protein
MRKRSVIESRTAPRSWKRYARPVHPQPKELGMAHRTLRRDRGFDPGIRKGAIDPARASCVDEILAARREKAASTTACS